MSTARRTRSLLLVPIMLGALVMGLGPPASAAPADRSTILVAQLQGTFSITGMTFRGSGRVTPVGLGMPGTWSMQGNLRATPPDPCKIAPGAGVGTMTLSSRPMAPAAVPTPTAVEHFRIVVSCGAAYVWVYGVGTHPGVGAEVVRLHLVGMSSPYRSPGIAVGSWDNSFVAGTPVRLADGTTMHIEDVTVGTLVAAEDPSDPGTARVGTVVGLVRHMDAAVYRIGVGNHAVEATALHPFFVRGVGWVQARDLRRGMRLQAEGWKAERVRAVIREPDVGRMVYNLVVDGAHTYLVGTSGLLVQDATPAPMRLRL